MVNLPTFGFNVWKKTGKDTSPIDPMDIYIFLYRYIYMYIYNRQLIVITGLATRYRTHHFWEPFDQWSWSFKHPRWMILYQVVYPEAVSVYDVYTPTRSGQLPNFSSNELAVTWWISCVTSPIWFAVWLQLPHHETKVKPWMDVPFHEYIIMFTWLYSYSNIFKWDE